MEHFYYGALRKTLIQFANIFNGLKIAKYDENGAVIKYINVPVKFAPKDTSYQSIMDCKRAKALPIIAIQLYGITHDPLRISNKSQYLTITKTLESGSSDTFLNPIPYNVDFQVSIICNYMIEMDQIIEQVLAYFNPHVFMRMRLAETGDQEYVVKVVFTSSTPDTPTQFQETEQRIVGWTLYFTAYSYFWTPVTQEGLTKKIITSYYTGADSFDTRSTSSAFTSGGYSDGDLEVDFMKAIGYDGDEIVVEEHLYSVEDYS
jgi:hypothetical protein